MKPLGFSVEEMRDLLSVLDGLDAATGGERSRETLIDRLAMYRETAEQRCAALRAQLETAEAFAADLRTEISRQRHLVGPAE